MLHLTSPKGLSPTGVGPALIVTQLGFVTLAVAASQRWPAQTRLAPALDRPLTVIGALWLALGIMLWALTLRRFIHDFPRGELITTGTYRYSRHPLYASLCLFLIPASALLAHTWTLLLAALAGTLVTSLAVAREERELERSFGDTWRSYRVRTSRLVPLPPIRGWLRSDAASSRAGDAR